MTLRLTLFALALSVLVATGQEPQLPRFRSGANLVAVDAYVSKDGVPVTDLRAEDLEVLEDDRPQKIESFRLVQSRAAGGITTRPEPLGSVAQRDAASDPESRLFVLFLDQWHVSLGGSARAQAPVSEILNRVISPDDLVGVMTPEMSPQSLNLTRRTAAIDRMLRDNWTWGERDKLNTSDPRERDLELCYPDDPRKPEQNGVAKELIERRRELRTLQSLDALVTHLGTLRDERKFVVLLTEGWVLFRRNDRLGGVLGGSIPGSLPIGVGTDGRIVTGQDPRESAGRGMESCDRERVLLSFVDHEYELRQIAQRANRANVSFYIIDPRGLAAFDDQIGPMRPATPEQDRARMSARQNGVRELAEQTDGAVVLNTNDVRGATARMMADLGSYYLMNYYSTNTKLDGRFRRITVRVRREGVEVRARPGYLAPTEAEARAAGVAPVLPPGSRGPAALPPTVARALEMIAPARGNLPVRIQAAGGRGSIRAVVELDPVTLKLPEWATGGTVRLTIDPEKGSGPESQVVTSTLDPGARSVVLAASGNPFPPGRYIVRAEVTPKAGRIPIKASTAAMVPPEAAEVGTGLLALRRGPSTGLAYVPTADPRFRRTERLRVEVPLAAAEYAGAARLLTREGQPMPLVATYTTRADAATSVTFGVAEIVLAPLAAGDYVLEVTLTKGKNSEVVAYGFRIVP
ncbi:MAG: VWA domain-containing protein [Acidobacteriota bacterium]|nr:VWA domain-containing protein [Acidobacteriota bacterium]